jgi:hypothetical protein
MLYDFDEGVASIYALQLVERGDFPLFGVRTSLGFYNPPTFIYLVAPAFLLSKSPLVAVAWLQMIGVAAFAAVATWLHRVGWRWGVILFLCFAMLAPGHVLLCRRLWGHALIPALSSGTLLLVWHAAYGRRKHLCWVLLPVLIALAQQVHFSGALLLFNAVAGCLALRARPAWKWLLPGCAVAALTYAPYLIHETRTGFADVGAVGHAIAGRTGGSEHATLWWAALLSLSDFGGATALQHFYGRFLRLVPEFHLLRAAGAGVLLVALLAAMRRWKHFSEGPADHALLHLALIWMSVPLVAFSALHVVTVPAYWLIALPGPFLLVGCLAEMFARSNGRPRIVCAGLGASCLFALVVFIRYHLEHSQVIAAADPGLVVYPSYRDQRDAIQFVVNSTGTRPVQIEENNGTHSIDYQLLYLVAWLDGNGTRLRHNPEEAGSLQHFIINRRPRIVPGVDGWPRRRFGLLDVYIQPGFDAAQRAQASPLSH